MPLEGRDDRRGGPGSRNFDVAERLVRILSHIGSPAGVWLGEISHILTEMKISFFTVERARTEGHCRAAAILS